MNPNVFKFLILFSFLPQLTLAKECRDISESYRLFFINGVGNPKLEVITEAAEEVSEKIAQFTPILALVNPVNNLKKDFLRKNLGTDFTWAEVQEVLQQKIQEYNKNKYVVDEGVVRTMYNKLDDKKVNIVFAHSQGNLYANSLCILNNGRKKQKNIGIGTPAKSVECGDSTKDYVTIDRDAVINVLRLAVLPTPLNQPLSSNVVVNSCELDSSCHKLVESYLSEPKPLAALKKIYDRKIEEVKQEELNFNLIDLKLTQVLDKDKSLLTNLSESTKETYSSLNMTYRRTIASAKTISYLTSVFNSSFIFALVNFNLKGINSKNLQSLLNTEINVETDQQYADIVGYILDTIHPYCIANSKYLPKSLVSVCKNYTAYYTPLSFSENKLFEKQSLSNPLMKWSREEKTLSLNCLDYLKNPQDQYSVTLSYVPDQVTSHIKVQDLSYEIHRKNFLNQKIEKENILQAVIKKENDSYKVSLKKMTDSVNKVNAPASDSFSKCNSLQKLFNSNCKDYLLKLMTMRDSYSLIKLID